MVSERLPWQQGVLADVSGNMVCERLALSPHGQEGPGFDSKSDPGPFCWHVNTINIVIIILMSIWDSAPRGECVSEWG